MIKTLKKNTKLCPEEFAEIVRLAPLVSVDLIVKDRHNRVLLGMRKNRPAKNFWFVPGGRVMKNERIADAIVRIAKDELGIKAAAANAKFLGVFEHLYKENFACKKGFGTHYVVLAYEIRTSQTQLRGLDEQHSRYEWFDSSGAVNNKKVHPNTKAYFKPGR